MGQDQAVCKWSLKILPFQSSVKSLLVLLLLLQKSNENVETTLMISVGCVSDISVRDAELSMGQWMEWSQCTFILSPYLLPNTSTEPLCTAKPLMLGI